MRCIVVRSSPIGDTMQKKDDDDMTKDNGDVTKDDGDKQEGEQEKKPTAKPVSLVTTGVKKSS